MNLFISLISSFEWKAELNWSQKDCHVVISPLNLLICKGGSLIFAAVDSFDEFIERFWTAFWISFCYEFKYVSIFTNNWWKLSLRSSICSSSFSSSSSFKLSKILSSNCFTFSIFSDRLFLFDFKVISFSWLLEYLLIMLKWTVLDLKCFLNMLS